MRALRLSVIVFLTVLGVFLASDSFQFDEHGWHGYKTGAASAAAFALAAVLALGSPREKT